MCRKKYIENLSGWLNEPYIQDEVIASLKRAEQPMLLREVADECSVPISSANRVLCRLTQRGWVRRFKLPMKSHRYCHNLRKCIPYAATRQLFAYVWKDNWDEWWPDE